MLRFSFAMMFRVVTCFSSFHKLNNWQMRLVTFRQCCIASRTIAINCPNLDVFLWRAYRNGPVFLFDVCKAVCFDFLDNHFYTGYYIYAHKWTILTACKLKVTIVFFLLKCLTELAKSIPVSKRKDEFCSFYLTSLQQWSEQCIRQAKDQKNL